MLTKDGREYKYTLHVSNVKGSKHNYLSLSFFDKSVEPPTVHTTKMFFPPDRNFPDNLSCVYEKSVAIQSKEKETNNPDFFLPSMIPLPKSLVKMIEESFTIGKKQTKGDALYQLFWDEGVELWNAFQIVIFDRAMQLVKLNAFSFCLAHEEALRSANDTVRNAERVIDLVNQALAQIDGKCEDWWMKIERDK